MQLDRWVSVSAKPLGVVFICVIVVGAIAVPGLANADTNTNENDATMAHSVTISSSDGTGSYFFRATEGLADGNSIESQGDDDIGKHRGQGSVTTDNSDTYRFDGQLSLFLSNNTDSMTVKVDGNPVSIDDIGSPDATMFDSSDDTYQPPHIIAITTSSHLIGYTFTAGDELEKTSDVDTGTSDSTDGTTAKGTVGENGFDTYRYAGKIGTLSSKNLDELTVYIDGDRVDSEKLKTGNGPLSSDENADEDTGEENTPSTKSPDTSGDDGSNGDSDNKSGSENTQSKNDNNDGNDEGDNDDNNDGGDESSNNGDNSGSDSSGSDSSGSGNQESKTAGTAPGDYKIRDLDIGPEPVRVGEEITVTVEVSNTAGERILTDVGLATEGEIASSETVGLFPPGSREVTFTHTYDAPGTYSIRVGGLNEDGEMKKISRRDPSIKVLPADAEVNRTTPTATPATTGPNKSVDDTGLNGSLKVTKFSPKQQTIVSNKSAMWDLVVENKGVKEASGTVTITTNSNETVIRQDSLTLAPGDSRGVTFAQVFRTTGNHTVRVGQQSANVSVIENGTRESVFQTPQTTEKTTVPTPVKIKRNTTNTTDASEREISVGTANSTTTANNSTTTANSSGSGPGFGMVIGILAVIVGSIGAIHRSHHH